VPRWRAAASADEDGDEDGVVAAGVAGGGRGMRAGSGSAQRWVAVELLLRRRVMRLRDERAAARSANVLSSC
jgi:hypothetical protein